MQGIFIVSVKSNKRYCIPGPPIYCQPDVDDSKVGPHQVAVP